VLFVVWGYIDRPNIPETLKAVIDVLAFVVPTLFLAAVVGLCVLWRSRLGMLGWMGMALAVYAWGWSVVGAIVGEEWPDYLPGWLLFLLSGLTLMGVATVRSERSRGAGAVVLATGAFGWVYTLTDSGAVFEARSVHVGFGLLFSVGWVVLGVGLLAASTKRTSRPQAEG
jgi:FtsH-binding integral membrane protein